MSADERSGPEIHGADEVERAVLDLAPADHKRLEAVAFTLMRNLGLKTASRDHEDLVSEAYARTLSGSRGWRRGVDLVRHLAETTRSVAWTWKERQDSEERAGELRPWEDALMAPDGDDAVDLPPGLYAPVRDAESDLIVKDGLSMFQRRFADDVPARQVIACWALGMKGPEIRRRTGLSEKELRAAIRRIRRFAQQGVGDGH